MSEMHQRIFKIDSRWLSVIVFSLFFSWLLAFPFEGRKRMLHAEMGIKNLMYGIAPLEAV